MPIHPNNKSSKETLLSQPSSADTVNHNENIDPIIEDAKKIKKTIKIISKALGIKDFSPDFFTVFSEVRPNSDNLVETAINNALPLSQWGAAISILDKIGNYSSEQQGSARLFKKSNESVCTMNQIKQSESTELWRAAIMLKLLEDASIGLGHIKRFIANQINSGIAQTQRISHLIFSNYWSTNAIMESTKNHYLPIQPSAQTLRLLSSQHNPLFITKLPRDLTGFSTALKYAENLANHNALPGRKALLPHHDISKLTNKTAAHQQIKGRHMPTQPIQVSTTPAASSKSARSKPERSCATPLTRESVVIRRDPAEDEMVALYTNFHTKQRELLPRCNGVINHFDSASIQRQELATDLKTISGMTNDLAVIASKFGAHSMAARLGEAAAGVGRIADGLSMLSKTSTVASTAASAASAGSALASTMSIVCSVAPYLAIAAGVASLGFGLFGSKGRKSGVSAELVAIHQSHQALMQAIQQSHQQLMQAMQCLGNMVGQVLLNQEKIYGTLQVTRQAVINLTDLVKQQHGENLAFFDLIAKGPLDTAIMAIDGDLKGTNAIRLTVDDRRNTLQILEHWLIKHLASPAMNGLASSTILPEISINILAQHQQSPLMIIGFVVAQLRAHLGNRVPAKFCSLPPFDLFAQATFLFIDGSQKAQFPSDDGYASIIATLQKTILTYQGFIQFLKVNPEIWTALFDQYEHHRNRVGRAISEANIPDVDVALKRIPMNDVKKAQLMEALNHMEEKRLLLCVLLNCIESEFSGSLRKLIHELGSKTQLLELKGTELAEHRKTYYSAIAEKNPTQLSSALRSGVDLNEAYPVDSAPEMRPARHEKIGIYNKLIRPDGVQEEFIGGDKIPGYHTKLQQKHPVPYTHSNGNALNRIAHLSCSQWRQQPKSKSYQSAVDLTYRLLSHNSEIQAIKLDLKATIPKNDFSESWWRENLAMRIMLNNAQYNLPLLYIAAGFDGPLDRETLGNLKTGNAMVIISSTADKNGKLNRYQLRLAYQYYQAVMRGQLAIADIHALEVNQLCLLWLVALLGNWTVFEKWISRTEPTHLNLADTVGEYTALMVAAEHGREDVSEGLLRMHVAQKDIGLNNKLSSGATAATLAFEQGHFHIAQRLCEQDSQLLSNKHQAELRQHAIPPNTAVVIPERVEMIALKEVEEHPTYQEIALQSMSTLINDASVVLAEIPSNPAPEQPTIVPVRAAELKNNDANTDSEDERDLNETTEAFCVNHGTAYTPRLWKKPIDAKPGVRQLNRADLSGHSAKFYHELCSKRGREDVSQNKTTLTVNLMTS